jgi:hypothetical protein
MIIFADGFDYYAAASDLLKKWTSQSDTNITTTGGAHGTQGVQLGNSSSGGTLSVGVSPATTTQGGVAFYCKLSASATSLDTQILQILESGTVHLQLKINADGSMSVHRGAGTTLLGTTAAGVFAQNVFHHIEIAFTIHDSTGVVTLRVDGTERLSLTGVDTRNGATGVWSSVKLTADVTAAGIGDFITYDNFIVWDASGSVNNTFLGPTRIKTIYPSGAGASTDFTPSAGSNYENVDEALMDADTTYNSETTPGDHDTYAYGDVGLTGTIKAVQVNLVVRSDGAGAETVAPVVRIGSTDYDGTAVGISTSYGVKTQIYEESPDTTDPWTVSEVDGAEFGIKLVT